ncbi:MAG: FAD-dependent oxidoreductase, partial [Halalkalicoccus sp.]|nr:FAD-dependent oxidoreductase [Halalkalicoccus sp.]
MTRIAVIGGGAVGLTAAYDLARTGEDVTVFERGALASGSTGRAAGVLYDA